jgi:hypothetical protein
MEEAWEKEQAPTWEHPAVTDKSIVYEDYIDEDYIDEDYIDEE